MVKVVKVKALKKKTIKVKRVAEDPPGSDEQVFPAERRTGRTMNVGRFLINSLAQTNPNVQRVRDALHKLSREDLADRLSLIYCEILGLSGTEAM